MDKVLSPPGTQSNQLWTGWMVASMVFVAQSHSLSLRLGLQVATQALDPGRSQFADIVSGDIVRISEGAWWHLQLELRFSGQGKTWCHGSIYLPIFLNPSGMWVVCRSELPHSHPRAAPRSSDAKNHLLQWPLWLAPCLGHPRVLWTQLSLVCETASSRRGFSTSPCLVAPGQWSGLFPLSHQDPSSSEGCSVMTTFTNQGGLQKGLVWGSCEFFTNTTPSVR